MSRGCHSALSPPSRGRPECGCTVCSASDRRIVICATDNADYDIGKFIAEDGVAKVPRWGWEKTVKSFAFLRIGRPAKDGEEADETKECIIFASLATHARGDSMRAHAVLRGLCAVLPGEGMRGVQTQGRIGVPCVWLN